MLIRGGRSARNFVGRAADGICESVFGDGWLFDRILEPVAVLIVSR
jgi:hypothetical protein